jgi:hypothetical protein
LEIDGLLSVRLVPEFAAQTALWLFAVALYDAPDWVAVPLVKVYVAVPRPQFAPAALTVTTTPGLDVLAWY